MFETVSNILVDIFVEYCKGLKDRRIMVRNGLIVITLHKKLSFPLRIYSVHVNKYAGKCGFGHIY